MNELGNPPRTDWPKGWSEQGHHLNMNPETGLMTCSRCHGGEVELDESCATRLAHQLRARDKKLSSMLSEDGCVNGVVKKYLERAVKGKEKYRVTVEGAPGELAKWLKHLQEELMDGTVYLEKLITILEGDSKHDRTKSGEGE